MLTTLSLLLCLLLLHTNARSQRPLATLPVGDTSTTVINGMVNSMKNEATLPPLAQHHVGDVPHHGTHRHPPRTRRLRMCTEPAPSECMENAESGGGRMRCCAASAAVLRTPLPPRSPVTFPEPSCREIHMLCASDALLCTARTAGLRRLECPMLQYPGSWTPCMLGMDESENAVLGLQRVLMGDKLRHTSCCACCAT